jgi:hypothetical protein
MRTSDRLRALSRVGAGALPYGATTLVQCGMTLTVGNSTRSEM